jgi:hypothetical protein
MRKHSFLCGFAPLREMGFTQRRKAAKEEGLIPGYWAADF